MQLEDYKILLSPTIILNLRLRGGSPRSRNPKGTVAVSRSSLPKGTELNEGQVNGGPSFKQIFKGKFVALAIPNHKHNKPDPHIVEQLNQTPSNDCRSIRNK